MTTKQALSGVGVLLIGAGLAGLLILAVRPCHEGHWERVYHAAWTEFRHVQTGKNSSVTIPIRHPEHCETEWVCDVRCGDIPRHDKHKASDWGLLGTDPRCEGMR